MKNKLIKLIALLGLSINVASAEAPSVNGNMGTKFSSDYHRRGQLVSQDAIQAQVGFNVGLGSVDVFGDFFTNQSTTSSGADNNELTVGLGTSFFEDKLNAYVGVYNTDNSVSGDNLEAFASVGLNFPLSPSVSVYRDTDDSLYTFEGRVSYDIDLEVVNLELAGILGNTDVSSLVDSTYLGAKLTATKTIKDNVDLYADVAVSDNDTRENETLWGVGLSVKF
ncbi:MAG: hypothetical protein O3A15_00030 [Proteobacteria bacterium]|nr:hypothetical protein [Pseudomonadota bacterium]